MIETRALTVRQPWAAAMFWPVGRKAVENRSWSTGYRGTLAIHAGLTIDDLGLDMLGPVSASDDRDRGHVIGLVDLVDVHDAGDRQCDDWGCHGDPWAFWPTEPTQRIVHWMLERPRRLVTPIKARGRVGLTDPGPSLAHLLSIAEVEQ